MNSSSSPSSTSHEVLPARPRDYAADAFNLPRAEFCYRHPYFFVARWSTILRFAAASAGADSYAAALRARLFVDLQIVQPSDASDDVTVGRGPENQIVIEDTSVSKLHARFRVVGRELRLYDNRSRNGTWVEKVAIQADGDGMVVEAGASIRFGDVECLLLDPGGCWDLVRTL
jgi:hypothetical protein